MTRRSKVRQVGPMSLGLSFVALRSYAATPSKGTISLAFLAADLVKAAIDGRLPHGMGVARLTDLPAEWSRQHQMLGLNAEVSLAQSNNISVCGDLRARKRNFCRRSRCLSSTTAATDADRLFSPFAPVAAR
jgi:hypothetical protein